jgi:hypothetical protein
VLAGRLPGPFIGKHMEDWQGPEDFITYSRSLVPSSIDFYSCFISYSAKDQTFADRLYAELHAAGVRCWYAPHDIKGGRKIHALQEWLRLESSATRARRFPTWVRAETLPRGRLECSPSHILKNHCQYDSSPPPTL